MHSCSSSIIACLSLLCLRMLMRNAEVPAVLIATNTDISQPVWYRWNTACDSILADGRSMLLQEVMASPVSYP